GPRRLALPGGAHLPDRGPPWGARAPLAPTGGEKTERAGGDMLETGAAGAPAAFFESVARDDARRRICGFSPIYAILRILGGAAGEVKRYGQWPDPDGVVTFASVVLE